MYLFIYFIAKSSTTLQLIALLAARDLVVDRVVARLPDLGLEVEVDELVLLGLPLAVGVAVVDHLAGAGVADLDRRVREGAVGGPGQLVAAVGLDGEGLGAADVAVAVDALFDGVVEDGALGDGVAGCGRGVSECTVLLEARGKGKDVLRTLVRARPLARSCWEVGRCMVDGDLTIGWMLVGLGVREMKWWWERAQCNGTRTGTRWLLWMGN